MVLSGKLHLYSLKAKPLETYVHSDTGPGMIAQLIPMRLMM